MGSLYNCIIGLICVIVGAMNIGSGTTQFIEALGTYRWPTVTGVVLASDVQVGNVRGGKEYIPNVHYQYQVQGKEFSGSRFCYFECGGSQTYARTTVQDQYPPGKHIAVAYNPKNPFQSILRPGPTWLVFFLFFLPWLVALVGVLLIHQGWAPLPERRYEG